MISTMTTLVLATLAPHRIPVTDGRLSTAAASAGGITRIPTVKAVILQTFSKGG